MSDLPLAKLVAEMPHDQLCPFSRQTPHLGPIQVRASEQYCWRCKLEAALAAARKAVNSPAPATVKIFREWVLREILGEERK